MLLIAATLLVFCSLAVQDTVAQNSPALAGRTMTITGQIAKSRHLYIIRSKAASEIFTIRNPNPEILDNFVESEKIVSVEASVISGDNIAIQKIDDEEYDPGTR